MSTQANSEFLAGGTDLLERRRSGVSFGPVQRIAPTEAMRAITWSSDGAAVIGGAVTIDALAHDAKMAAAYPGLVAAAAGLATPEIRRMATVGGNLTQRTRCWYYRNHNTACLKKGGTTCPARAGNHLYGVAFDIGPCVAPHPSTLGAALMAYDAVVDTSARAQMAVADVFGDGTDGTRDHTLAAGELLTRIALPAPVTGERAVYRRAISRAAAEWPLVEIVARVVVDGGRVQLARVAVGGVAPVPLRLTEVETALAGASVDALPTAEVQRLAVVRAKPLSMTSYKVQLLQGLLADALQSLATPTG